MNRLRAIARLIIVDLSTMSYGTAAFLGLLAGIWALVARAFP